MLSKHYTRRPSGPERSAVWVELLAVAGIFLVATLIAAMCGAAIKIFSPGIDFAALASAIYALQFLLAIAGIRIYLGRDGRRALVRFTFNWYNAPLALWGIVLVTAAGIVLEPLLDLFPESYFERLNGMLDGGGWAILLTVVLAPVFEEILFRGLLLESLLRRWKGWQAVAMSALLFGLVHMPILPQMVNAAVVGLVLGYVYALTRSLAPVVIIHAVNNGVAYLLLEITGTQNSDTRRMIGDDTLYWIVFGTSAAILAASVALMWFFAEKRNTKISQTTLHEEITHDEPQI